MLKTAMTGVEGTYVEEQLLVMERSGYRDETYYTFSYSPIPNEDGSTGGIICANTDDTERVTGRRRQQTLRDLAVRTSEEAKTEEEACRIAADAIKQNPRDIPFALIYLVDPDARRARIIGTAGLASVFRSVIEKAGLRLQEVRSLPANRGGTIPAVALTAYARTEDRLRALRAGYQMHVPKPIEYAELITVMASLVGRNHNTL
jgi:CheY-like chemotaxis protein